MSHECVILPHDQCHLGRLLLHHVHSGRHLELSVSMGIKSPPPFRLPINHHTINTKMKCTIKQTTEMSTPVCMEVACWCVGRSAGVAPLNIHLVPSEVKGIALLLC